MMQIIPNSAKIGFIEIEVESEISL